MLDTDTEWWLDTGMNKLTASPVEFDTALAALYQDVYSAGHEAERAWTTVHYVAGDRKHYRTGWGMDHETARVKAVAIKNEMDKPWAARDAANALKELGLARQKMTDIGEEIAEFNQVFIDRGCWSRVFLVTNGNGHAHSSMQCSTCYPTTEYHWVTELSGHSEEEIVNAAADRACTVCFPTAPVNKPSTLRTPDEIDKAKAREERAAAKAARDAKKAANAPTKAGLPLRVEYTWDRGDRVFKYSDTFQTERAAIIWATDKIAFSNNQSELNAVNEIVNAIAEKRDVSPEYVRAEFEKKAAKKRG